MSEQPEQFVAPAEVPDNAPNLTPSPTPLDEDTSEPDPDASLAAVLAEFGIEDDE